MLSDAAEVVTGTEFSRGDPGEPSPQPSTATGEPARVSAQSQTGTPRAHGHLCGLRQAQTERRVQNENCIVPHIPVTHASCVDNRSSQLVT